jgi:toxin HigB-1
MALSVSRGSPQDARYLVTNSVAGYTYSRIKGFKLKGLERFFLQGTRAGIQPRHATRLRLILARLHASTRLQDMNLPGLQLHELKGEREGTWAVKVSGNWRVTFVFRGEDVELVDYEDYH